MFSLDIEERNEGTDDEKYTVIYAVLREPGKMDMCLAIAENQLPFFNALRNLTMLPCDHTGFVVRVGQNGKRYCGGCSVDLDDRVIKLPKYSWNPGSCCGDAHMELVAAKSHLKALGFSEERTETPHHVEILWRNTRAEAVEKELRQIDAALDRRPALAELKTRYDKVYRACAMAGRAEMAEKRVADLLETCKEGAD